MQIEKEEFEKLEISSSVQNLIAAMETRPRTFTAYIGLLGMLHLEDLETNLEGAISYTNTRAFHYIECTCTGDFSFMSAKEGGAVYEKIQSLIKLQAQFKKEDAKERFESAYKTPQEGRG